MRHSIRLKIRVIILNTTYNILGGLKFKSGLFVISCLWFVGVHKSRCKIMGIILCI